MARCCFMGTFMSVKLSKSELKPQASGTHPAAITNGIHFADSTITSQLLYTYLTLGRAIKMDLLQTVRKEGSRGGVNFSWDEVKNSQHRE